MTEHSITIQELPKKLFHIVPVNLFNKYTNERNTYDPRNKKDFGKNSPFIHTTPSIEQMNNHLTYLEEMQDKEFYLLEINSKELKPLKVTYAEFNGRRYHHLWCSLPKDVYKVKLVHKGTDGKISL